MLSSTIVHAVNYHGESEVGNVIAIAGGTTIWDQACWITEDEAPRKPSHAALFSTTLTWW